MRPLFRLPGAVGRDPAVEAWMEARPGELGSLARRWFEVVRGCGEEVRETVHDGQPTACVDGAAFAYVDAFSAHVNLGFFHGAALPDPGRLMEGTGKYMRHVKLRPGEAIDGGALENLIRAAYADVKARLVEEAGDC